MSMESMNVAILYRRLKQFERSSTFTEHEAEVLKERLNESLEALYNAEFKNIVMGVMEDYKVMKEADFETEPDLRRFAYDSLLLSLEDLRLFMS